MTDAVKLLTEAEARDLYGRTSNQIFEMLRERGLFAPEPVDPLLIEAREICAKDAERGEDALAAGNYRNGNFDGGVVMSVALAALKRGMEMRPPLTREMVREALRSALKLTDTPIEFGDFAFSEAHTYRGNIESVVDRLHAALTKEQS